jgi:KaiC/GvpD/RAD55 family RecA-like ATPase
MEYTADVQKLFLEFLLQDASLYTRVSNIYNADNFDRSIKQAAKFIQEHAEKHTTLPDRVQVQAVGSINLQPIEGINQGHIDWFLTEFENFTRRKELERAILKSADLLEKGEYDPVEKLIKDAVQISLTKDMGTDYFLDPRTRLMRLKNNNGQVPTGWAGLDRKLYGGFNRGELQIFAGGSGSGKSLFMQNLGCNWTAMGLNGGYITLELSEDLCAMRIDSMLTGKPTKEIFRDLDDIELQVKMLGRKSGKFYIKYLPAQSTVNDIRSYVKELQIRTGVQLDFLCVDYLDLLMPVSAKVSPNDLFVKDKYVSEELRNLAKELNVVFVTASQLNRSAVEEIEFDHSHISGGISKINTADNVFGIFTSRAMRERGKYQLQLMKTRSSSGVGQKVDLDFDVNSLRITDSGIESDGSETTAAPVTNIMNQLKTTSSVRTKESAEYNMTSVKADVQGSKLKSMLAQLKNKAD